MARHPREEKAEWSGKKWLICSICGDEEMRVGGDVKSIICPRCVQRMVDPPDLPEFRPAKESDNWPKGWWLKLRYEAPNGKLYSKGEEVSEEFLAEQESLKQKEKASKTKKTTKKVVKKVKKTTRRSR